MQIGSHKSLYDLKFEHKRVKASKDNFQKNQKSKKKKHKLSWEVVHLIFIQKS